MTIIEIANTPTHYLQTHAADIEKAFSAGMSAKQIYKALNESEYPPPMSYRSFCRLTRDHRKKDQHPSRQEATASSTTNQRKTPDEKKEQPFKIATFKHKDSNPN